MKIYLAGNPSIYTYPNIFKNMFTMAMQSGLPQLRGLASFITPQHFDWMVERRNELLDGPDIRHAIFLDSGAFSVWKSGRTIDLNSYIEFINNRIQDIEVAVNLDVIPGKFRGPKVKNEQREEACTQGYKNYFKMAEDSKLPTDRIIHVFHKEDSFKWLKKFMDDGVEYVGLAPGQFTGQDQKIKWLDRCMDYVTDDKGRPRIRFHGFAVTAMALMMRYPWYSVDSTSWVIAAAHGKLIFPRFNAGRPDYTRVPIQLGLSDLSPSKDKQGHHLTNISQKDHDLVMQYIKDNGYILGKSSYKTVDSSYKLKKNERYMAGTSKTLKTRSVEVIEEWGLINDYKIRAQLNAKFMFEFEAKWERDYFVEKLKSPKLFI